MNRKVIRLIIVLTTISLVAALITQLLWVRDAWNLQEDQFNNRVKIALKSVVNQLLTSDEFAPDNSKIIHTEFYTEHKGLFRDIDPVTLDSLIQAEMGCMKIRKDYVYGVFRKGDSAFVMGVFDGYEKELLNSPHWVSLTCICKSENYLLAIYFEHQQKLILDEMAILPVMSGLFLLTLVFSFFFTIYAIIKQKKLSEIKTDFVNNMTHEFKTPISTISVSSEMLTKDKVIESPEKIKKYARIIFDENTRLKNQVERVLQIAILDKKDFKLKMKETDVHEIIQSCIDNFKIIIDKKNGKLNISLKAEPHIIIADRVHLTNIINNLLDNANKYSFETPEILITTANLKGKIEIAVEDKGIGINKENLHDIFKKFHRIQTGDIHNVKGFGLGLFYVKTMVEEMGGTIEVKSEINKGSRFILYFPL